MKDRIYYESGELRYEGESKPSRSGFMPYGRGISYYLNGHKHLEGIFDGWNLDVGLEFYPEGQLKFEGHFNKRPYATFGPRHYASGILYREDGSKWFVGTFNILKRGALETPQIKFPECFYDGIEHGENGELTFHVPSDFINYLY
jgi:hypothetical protein